MAAILMITVLPIQTAAPQSLPPARAPYLPSKEIKQIYSGKTWRWGEGGDGAYFDPKGKYFALADKSYAIGRWKAERWGNLCIVFDWHEPKRTYRNVKQCFQHVVWNGKIYQKKYGESFYAFSSYPPKSNEALRKGDSISTRIPARK